MNMKSDSRGITMVELVVVVALVSVVLLGAYHFLFFSANSLRSMEASYCAEQDSKMAMISLQEDIRSANAVNFGGSVHKAVEIYAGGMQMNVYTDTDSDDVLEIVQYKLENNQLIRGVATLGNDPTEWSVLVGKVQNKLVSPQKAMFTIVNKVININLLVIDEKDVLLDEPIYVNLQIRVRSKGAMD